ncbi:hypothetical protein C8Q80DRAFT_479177 [Daedaleopsis nitida]|nr:hypothetical protein C8Q80DRAFT_479177 [Daedaleopsis nitida]
MHTWCVHNVHACGQGHHWQETETRRQRAPGRDTQQQYESGGSDGNAHGSEQCHEIPLESRRASLEVRRCSLSDAICIAPRPGTTWSRTFYRGGAAALATPGALFLYAVAQCDSIDRCCFDAQCRTCYLRRGFCVHCPHPSLVTGHPHKGWGRTKHTAWPCLVEDLRSSPCSKLIAGVQAGQTEERCVLSIIPTSISPSHPCAPSCRIRP